MFALIAFGAVLLVSSRPSVCPIRRRGTAAGVATAEHRPHHLIGRCGTNGGCQAAAPTVLLLSTSDTDLITARASGAGYRWANPSRLVDGELEELLAGADVAVVRILGGYRAWQDGIDTVVASGVPTVVVSGEQSPDADLMGHSTTPGGRRAAGPHLSRPGRHGEPAAAARLPLRHAVDDRLRVRAAGDHAELGRPRPALRATATARRSRCSTTAPSTWPETPATSRRCAGPSRTQAVGRCRSSAHRCALPTPGCWTCSPPPTRW